MPKEKSAKPRIRKIINYSDRYRDFLSPKYWPTWLGLSAMQIFAFLPYQANQALGKLVGYLLYSLGHSRRHIASTNIALCFPELTAQEQKQLVKRSMIDNGVGLLEMCTAWFNHKSIKPEMIDIEGEEHLTKPLASGQGVILVGAHYSTLDLGGVFMAKYKKVGVMYRANKNPLLDLVMRSSRQKFCEQVIERSDMRAVIRFIKNGGIMWYAPDQDYGPKQSVFAPFFGIDAATITVIPRLVKINNSSVHILGHHRKPDGKGYKITISEALKDYPSGNQEQDAALINASIESRIREYPEQYMWLHRRFKTRPEGQAKVYKKK